ncbi:MAG TPA: hypothetical protein VN803_10995 [Gemmatimonadales bacterium]|nr:hypothetical protein [Gemmatimonadales bacterium]
MVAALTGCSHRHAESAGTTPDEGWTLTIINHHWLDVSVYIMSDGRRSHIGTVSATQTANYDMPARLIGPGRMITLEANPIGATRAVRSDALSIQGGQRVEWTLETGLERSTVAVY